MLWLLRSYVAIFKLDLRLPTLCTWRKIHGWMRHVNLKARIQGGWYLRLDPS